MKKIVLSIAILFTVLTAFSQSKIENYLEGKKYQNSQTGLIIQFGYISALNTNGFTFTNSNDAKFYFMNCSVEVSSDETFAVFTDCMNPDNGGGVGKIYAYKTKIIIVAADGKLVYNLISGE